MNKTKRRSKPASKRKLFRAGAENADIELLDADTATKIIKFPSRSARERLRRAKRAKAQPWCGGGDDAA